MGTTQRIQGCVRCGHAWVLIHVSAGQDRFVCGPGVSVACVLSVRRCWPKHADIAGMPERVNHETSAGTNWTHGVCDGPSPLAERDNFGVANNAILDLTRIC